LNFNKIIGISPKLLLLIAFLGFQMNSFAQCAMCRASLESESNQATAESVNNGIVYLMALPYILVAAAFYGVYLIRKKKNENKKSDAI